MPPISILVALADPTRCRIIEILQAGPRPVHQIAAAFDISRPAISRHLSVLKEARLISEKKTGRENLYALHAKRLKPVQQWLDAVTTVSKPDTKTPAKAKRPTAAPVVEPVPAVTPVPPPPALPRRDVPASQMGFDF